MTATLKPPPPLPADAAALLAEFARTCKAAARAVALYPDTHPAIETTLSRLAALTTRLTAAGPYRLTVRVDTLLVEGAAPAKADAAVAELADGLHRHLIGALTINAGADAQSWKTLLSLLARTPEEARADGGIGHLWATAGGPSLEIQEIDYAEVLREKQGQAATLDEIIAAALSGPQLQLDDSAMRVLLEIVQDPARLQDLVGRLDVAATERGVEAGAAAFLSLLKGLTEYVARTDPDRLNSVFTGLGRAVGRLSAEAMVGLLAQRPRPEAVAGGVNVVGAVVDRMDDQTVAQFVAGSVVREGGATERLAHAFQSLVPEYDRQRQLLDLAREETASSSPAMADDAFADLWERVEAMLTSYSDAQYVSADYGRELAIARTRPLEVERTSDDPPERIAAWLATVNDAALRSLDRQLLLDLLAIEVDELRWRDIAETAISRADDLVLVGYFDQAWELAEAVTAQAERHPLFQPHATAALERFGRGAMMKHVAGHLRAADDASVRRVARVCHAIGTPVIAPLAEVLSAERDARSRRRLRDILVGFGARGRESVQRLMSAPNWEVRRTAAFLLREFGGAEGLKELMPLLSDSEPLVQREAVQALVLNGSEAAAAILLEALNTGTGRTRGTLITELTSIRDERAATVFSHLLRHIDRRTRPEVYLAAIDGLAASRAGEAVDALKAALAAGEWWAPVRTRRLREAAAMALRRMNTPASLEALRAAANGGPRRVRAAARAALSGS